MRVTCPNCQCRGLIDTAPLLSKARVTCVRCGTAYDALLVEGVVQTAPVAEQSASAPELAVSAEPLSVSESMAEPDEVLALPQETAQEVLVNERNVLDFSSPAQAEDEAQDLSAFTSVPSQADDMQSRESDASATDPLA